METEHAVDISRAALTSPDTLVFMEALMPPPILIEAEGPIGALMLTEADANAESDIPPPASSEPPAFPVSACEFV